MRLIRVALLFLAIFWSVVGVFSPETANALPFCGRFDVLGLPDTQILDLLENQSLATVAGPRTMACGLKGESLQVCRACIDRPSEDQWAMIRGFLARTDHRAWHYQWHLKFREPTEPSDEELRSLRVWGLASPNETGREYADRMRAFPGESFLFMHRQMIRMLQIEMTSLGLPCVSPWEKVPQTALDPVWPIPTAVGAPEDEKEIYDSQIKALIVEAKKFEDDRFLASVSLDQLGTRILGNLHIMLHTIYGNRPEQLRRDCVGPQETSKTCDDLGDNMSAHVNIHFWKLHGYIDGLLGRWLKVHGYRELRVRCEGRRGCYQWQGAYLGPAYPGFGAARP